MNLRGVYVAAALALATVMLTAESSAQVTYLGKTEFVSQTGQRIGATFEDVPVQQSGPFNSGSVHFPGDSMRVTNSYPVPEAVHAVHFGSQGSAPNFVAIAGTTWDVRATFSVDVRGVGFDLGCVACDLLPNDSALDWKTYDAFGNLVESGTLRIDLSPPFPAVRFFGLMSDYQFRTIHVKRRSISQPGLLGAWVIDDVRFIPVPDGALQVPTLRAGWLFATVGIVLLIGALNYRRVA